MSLTQFVILPDGKEFPIDDEQVGFVQSCGMCGAAIAPPEPDGTVTTDAIRYMGKVQVAAVIPGPGAAPQVPRNEAGFELCHPCAVPVLEPLGLIPDEAHAAAAAELDAAAAAVDEHHADELAHQGAEHDEQTAAAAADVDEHQGADVDEHQGADELAAAAAGE
jgi:hypothetical protein